MSWLTTEGFIINQPTGLPVPTGSILTTESGTLLTTTPIGEPPGGVNSTPGTDPNFPSDFMPLQITNSNDLILGTPNLFPIEGNQVLGVPYGYSAPVYIGPLVPPP